MGSVSYETGEVRVGSVHSVDKSTSGRRLLLTGVASLRGRTATRLPSIKARILLLLAVPQWAVSNGKIDQAHAFAQYNKLIDTAQAIYDASNPGSAQLTKEETSILELDQARELVSREDALLTGALAARKYTVDDHEQFAPLVAQHRLLLLNAPRGLSSEDQSGFERLTMSPEYGRFQGLEEQLVQTPGSTTRTPPVDIGSWHTASESVVSQLDALEGQALALAIQRA